MEKSSYTSRTSMHLMSVASFPCCPNALVHFPPPQPSAPSRSAVANDPREGIRSVHVLCPCCHEKYDFVIGSCPGGTMKESVVKNSFSGTNVIHILFNFPSGTTADGLSFPEKTVNAYLPAERPESWAALLNLRYAFILRHCFDLRPSGPGTAELVMGSIPLVVSLLPGRTDGILEDPSSYLERLDTALRAVVGPFYCPGPQATAPRAQMISVEDNLPIPQCRDAAVQHGPNKMSLPGVPSSGRVSPSHRRRGTITGRSTLRAVRGAASSMTAYKLMVLASAAAGVTGVYHSLFHRIRRHIAARLTMCQA